MRNFMVVILIFLPEKSMNTHSSENPPIRWHYIIRIDKKNQPKKPQKPILHEILRSDLILLYKFLEDQMEGFKSVIQKPKCDRQMEKAKATDLPVIEEDIINKSTAWCIIHTFKFVGAPQGINV